jgi:formate dehydrogenase iron-sulfur subunit
MYGLLFDANRCIGCGACMDACKSENDLPASDGEVLSATDYTVVEDRGNDLYLRRMCMHCLEPSCASACPVGALRKTADGPVVYDFDRCIGCRYCMVACPFGVPRYEWTSTTPRVRKCQMCPHRVSKGQPTACAEACDEGATIFGDRSHLLAEAWKRISAEPDRYAPRVYGAEEAGGTSVLIIGPPEIMAAFDPRIPMESLPKKTWAVLSQIPTAVGVAGAGLLGVHWIINRRMMLAAGKASDLEGSESGNGSGSGDEAREGESK